MCKDFHRILKRDVFNTKLFKNIDEAKKHAEKYVKELKERESYD